jgi:hypothetical protein
MAWKPIQFIYRCSTCEPFVTLQTSAPYSNSSQLRRNWDSSTLALASKIRSRRDCGLGDWNICSLTYPQCRRYTGRSQWPRGLRHKPSSPARTLGSWVRIPLGAWMFDVRLFCVCVVLCVGSGLETGWSPAQWVLPTVYTIKKLKKSPRSTRAVDR